MLKKQELKIDRLFFILFFTLYFIFLTVNINYLFRGDDWWNIIDSILRRAGYYEGQFSPLKIFDPKYILSYSYGALKYLQQGVRVILFYYQVIPFGEGSYRLYEGMANFLVMIGLFLFLWKKIGFDFAFLYVLLTCFLPRELCYQRGHGFYLIRIIIMMTFVFLDQYLKQNKLKDLVLFYGTLAVIFIAESFSFIYFFFLALSLLIDFVLLKKNSLKDFFIWIYEKFLNQSQKIVLLAGFIFFCLLVLAFNFVVYRAQLVGNEYKFQGLYTHLAIVTGNKEFIIDFERIKGIILTFISGTNLVYFILLLISLAASIYLMIKDKKNSFNIMLLFHFFLVLVLFYQITFYYYTQFNYQSSFHKVHNVLAIPSIGLVSLTVFLFIQKQHWLLRKAVLFSLLVVMVLFALPTITGKAEYPKPYGVPGPDQGYKGLGFLFRRHIKDHYPESQIGTNMQMESSERFYLGVKEIKKYQKYSDNIKIFLYEVNHPDVMDLEKIEAELKYKTWIKKNGQDLLIIYSKENLNMKAEYELESLNQNFKREYSHFHLLF